MPVAPITGSCAAAAVRPTSASDSPSVIQPATAAASPVTRAAAAASATADSATATSRIVASRSSPHSSCSRWSAHRARSAAVRGSPSVAASSISAETVASISSTCGPQPAGQALGPGQPGPRRRVAAADEHQQPVGAHVRGHVRHPGELSAAARLPSQSPPAYRATTCRCRSSAP